MPRIYADVEAHSMDWGAVDFVNGVAALPAGSSTAYWTGASYAVDANKNSLTLFDRMTKADLQELLTYQGVSWVAGDTKQALVRKAETFASTHLLAALTVASTAGSATGDTDLAITGEVGTEGNTLAFKTGTATYAPLYKDEVDDTWTAFTDGDNVTPGDEADTKVTVVELNAAGEVVAVGNDDLVVKSA